MSTDSILKNDHSNKPIFVKTINLKDIFFILKHFFSVLQLFGNLEEPLLEANKNVAEDAGQSSVVGKKNTLPSVRMFTALWCSGQLFTCKVYLEASEEIAPLNYLVVNRLGCIYSKALFICTIKSPFLPAAPFIFFTNFNVMSEQHHRVRKPITFDGKCE